MAAVHATDHGTANPEALRVEQSNNRMQLTKLRAAPGRAYKVPPCAPAVTLDGGTASQLIRRVGQTRGECEG